jgi:hypothetical protein
LLPLLIGAAVGDALLPPLVGDGPSLADILRPRSFSCSRSLLILIRTVDAVLSLASK